MITEVKINSFNLKYFSHLDKNQKQRTINYLRIFLNGLYDKSYKSAVEILNNLDSEKTIKQVDFIKTNLKAQKVFRDPILKTYFPLNCKEILSKKKDCLNCGNKVKYLFCNLDCEKEYTNE